MLQRITIWLACILGVLALVTIGAGIWFIVSVNSFLLPPADPVGQLSIASYATAEPAGQTIAPPLVGHFSWTSIAQPPKSARPWTRWWWPGADVEAEVLLTQLKQLDAANFGGAEIQPFTSGLQVVSDEEILKRVNSFDTPDYYDSLRAVMAGASELDWQLDLTHFSGWPPGGPEVNLEDSLTNIVYGQSEVTGGRKVSIALPTPKPGPNEYIFSLIEFAGGDFINFPVDQAHLLSVVAARKTAGKHSWNPLNLGDTETLDPESVRVLTAAVTDGVLHWNAPPGDWQIIASYIMPSGEAPMLIAKKQTGFVIDHLRIPQLVGHYEYAFGARTGLAPEYGKAFRGFFNDSLEFRLKRMGTLDILSEFKKRRGYDLEPYLPAIYVEGIDNVYFGEILGLRAQPEFQLTSLDDRIRYDYQHTLSDLLIERFVETSANWAESRGLSSRAQSYGMDIDILRALGANTIPETEQLWAGGSDLALKMASSAAALYGKPLASAESFVWSGHDYTSTARKIKAAADKLLLAGINHIIFHGTPAQWRGGAPGLFGDEGWTPFSGPKNQGHFSSNFGPGNTQLWPDIADLNRYIARSQNLLRQGSPAVDVLIYYPYLGFDGHRDLDNKHEQTLLNGSLPDADPFTLKPDPVVALKPTIEKFLNISSAHISPRDQWTRQLVPLLQALDRRGISWAWVNADAIESGKVTASKLDASGGSFQAMLLPDVQTIAPATLTALSGLVEEGAQIYFAGGLPIEQPGFRDSIAGDRAVKLLTRELLADGAKQLSGEAAEQADALQLELDKPLKYTQASRIKHYRRDLEGDVKVYFFANQDAAPQTLALSLALENQSEKSGWWFDALQGVAWPLETADSNIQLQLSGFASRFLILGAPMPTTIFRALADDVLFPLARQQWSLNDWQLSIAGGASEPVGLVDWRETPSLIHEQGPGIYSHTFELEMKNEQARYLISLGLVQGSASVIVNGTAVGRASIPPFIVDLSPAIRQGHNSIEIEVLAPLRNAFVGRALKEMPQYSHMLGFEDQLVAAGLLGPVTIAEVAGQPVLEQKEISVRD